MQYPFRRDFYYQIKDSLKKYPVTVLLGPLKCGKTVCLKQLNEDLEHSKYFDFKTLSEDEALLAFDEVLDSVQKNTNKIFLLDDVFYVNNIETKLWKIARLCQKKNSKTRIVLAGSQMYPLEAWVSRAFHLPVEKIRVGFLSYSEYIRYRNIPEPFADTNDQYLQEVIIFHQIGLLIEYLTECLNETIVSNANTSDYLFNNDCYLVEGHVEFLEQVYLQSVGLKHENECSDEIPLSSDIREQALQLLKNWGLS